MAGTDTGEEYNPISHYPDNDQLAREEEEAKNKRIQNELKGNVVGTQGIGPNGPINEVREVMGKQSVQPVDNQQK